MNKKYLLNEIARFILKIKKDYEDNRITKVKYYLMYTQLGNLIKNSNDTDLVLLITKFNTIKTIYLIMK